MTTGELEFVGLRRRYGSVTALDGLTFAVPAGQVFGFLGPNGASKTTTTRAIFGVASLDAGKSGGAVSRSTVLYATGDGPLWQVVVSAMLCAAATVWMARLAAGIYSRSILRTGARVPLRQVLRREPAQAHRLRAAHEPLVQTS
jgi:energy-coupling factor transporter ATP-binding protein EcfA2